MSSFFLRKVDGYTDRWECESCVADPDVHRFGKRDPDPHQTEKSFLDPHQIQYSKVGKAQNGVMEGRAPLHTHVEASRLKVEPWSRVSSVD